MANTFVIERNDGSYFDGYFSETSCGWTFLSSCAETYETRAKASAMARKINKAYGHKICSTTTR